MLKDVEMTVPKTAANFSLKMTVSGKLCAICGRAQQRVEDT